MQLGWIETQEFQMSNLAELNARFQEAKGHTQNLEVVTFQLDPSTNPQFKLHDLDGLYLSEQSVTDFSHHLEIVLDENKAIDYEALGTEKQLTVKVNAHAKAPEELNRLFGEERLEDLLQQQKRLNLPSSITFSIAVQDVNEPPVVNQEYQGSTIFNKGKSFFLKDTDEGINVPLTDLFEDPESRTLYAKPNLEDVELQEYRGIAPNYELALNQIGDTALDSNSQNRNSPATDGNIVIVEFRDSSYTITPIKGSSPGVRKVEVIIQGWDERGPTVPVVSLDPAATKESARFTVFVQTGENQPPYFSGGVTSFGIDVYEGYVGVLSPTFGHWSALDQDGATIKHSLQGQSLAGSCEPLNQPGIDLYGICFRIRESGAQLLVEGVLDYEAMSNPVIPLTLVAEDEFGATARVGLSVIVKDLDEPVIGQFNPSQFVIHQPTQPNRYIDLRTAFVDPEAKQEFKFRVHSRDEQVVSAELESGHILALRGNSLGAATVDVWAESKNPLAHTTLEVLVREENVPPTFLGETTALEFLTLESTPPDMVIGEVIGAEDENESDHLSFSLSANRLFGLDHTGLKPGQTQIKVKAPLDYETAQSHKLELTVSDGIDSSTREIVVRVGDVDDPPMVIREDMSGIQVGENLSLEYRPLDLFQDDTKASLGLQILGYDPEVISLSIDSNQVVTLNGLRLGSTEVTYFVRDTLGRGAIAYQTIDVIETQAPVLLEPIPDQTVITGLNELSLEGVFEDPDSDFAITGVASSDEDLLWAFLPKNAEDLLVMYAWEAGTATVTVTAEDTAGNTTETEFAVTIIQSAQSVQKTANNIEMIQGEDRTIELGQIFPTGTLRLDELKVLAKQPDLLEIETNQENQSIHLSALKSGRTPIVVLGKSADQVRRAIKLSVTVSPVIPRFVGEVDDLHLELGSEVTEVDLRAMVIHPNPLVFETHLSELGVVRTSVVDGTLFLEALDVGRTSLTLKATDAYGYSAQTALIIHVSDEYLRESERTTLSLLTQTTLASVSKIVSKRTRESLSSNERSDLDIRSDSKPEVEGYPYEWHLNPTSALSRDAATSEASLTLNENAGLSANDPRTNQSGLKNLSSRLSNLNIALGGSENHRSFHLWTATDTQNFGFEDIEGRMSAYYLGTDVRLHRRISVGMAGSKQKGVGYHTFGSVNGFIASDQTLWIPYLQAQLTEEINTWLILAKGSGSLVSTRNGEITRRAGMGTRLASLGGSYELMNRKHLSLTFQSEWGAIATKTDTSLKDGSSLSATGSQAIAGLAASNQWNIGRLTVIPHLEVNYMKDSGQGFKEQGIEINSGATFKLGSLAIELDRDSLLHQSEDSYKRSSTNISASFTPSQDGTGWSVRFSPSWGTTHGLLGASRFDLQETPSYLIPTSQTQASTTNKQKAMTLDLGYGWLWREERVLVTPFLREANNNLNSKEIGVRLKSLSAKYQGFEAQVGIQQSQLPNSKVRRSIAFTGSIHF